MLLLKVSCHIFINCNDILYYNNLIIYKIIAQVLAGGRGKGYFKEGNAVGGGTTCS